jgi:deoxycytidylate deaminase
MFVSQIQGHLMNKVWRMLRYARKESRRSDHHHKIGVVICQGSVMQSRGFNQIRAARIGITYTNYPESLHAERHACMQVQRESIQGSDLYIWRETREGLPANARPCANCLRMLVDLEVRRIIHSDSEFPFYRVIRL